MKVIVRLGIELQKANDIIANRTLPKFANNQRNVRIDFPRNIVNPAKIRIGDNVWLGPNTFLIALKIYPGPSMRLGKNLLEDPQIFDSKISIGNRVTSTSGLQIASAQEVVIEDDVLFASNIHINDSFHGFESADIPYKYQKISRIAPIRIKSGSWIGQNSVILAGVTIGNLCIVGANSVVTKNIPDKCITVGNPSRIVKQWDDEAKLWIPFDEGEKRL